MLPSRPLHVLSNLVAQSARCVLAWVTFAVACAGAEVGLGSEYAFKTNIYQSAIRGQRDGLVSNGGRMACLHVPCRQPI